MLIQARREFTPLPLYPFAPLRENISRQGAKELRGRKKNQKTWHQSFHFLKNTFYLVLSVLFIPHD